MSHGHHTTPSMQHAMVGMQGPPMHFAQAQQQVLAQQQVMPPQVHYQQQQKSQLQQFWQQQFQEMEQVNEFKNHQLPLARIKKIMKSDEDVKMIAAEAPVLFAKACEMFILELTLRSWIHTEENKRRTLQRNDIAGAITRGDIFDFLVDIVPRDELKEEDIGSVAWPAGVSVAGPDPNVGYGGAMYYPPMGQDMMMQAQNPGHPGHPGHPGPQAGYPPPQ